MFKNFTYSPNNLDYVYILLLVLNMKFVTQKEKVQTSI